MAFKEVLDILLDALIDTAKLLPLLFVVYYLIEILEYKNVFKFEKSKLLTGKASPVLGATFGVIPQCGFSVISAELYSERKMSLGALVAVFVATSDEAIPILISNPTAIPSLLMLILSKFLIAIVVGYVVMFLSKFILKNSNTGAKNSENKRENSHAHFHKPSHHHSSKNLADEKMVTTKTFEKTSSNEIQKLAMEQKSLNEEANKEILVEDLHEHQITLAEIVSKEDAEKLEPKEENALVVTAHEFERENHEHDKNGEDDHHTHKEAKDEKHHKHLHACCHHDIEETEKFDWVHPLVHSLKIALYILIVNILLGIFVALIGEDNIASFLTKSSVFQPVLALIIGFIPNCASSVIITELYTQGLLSFGSIIAGLSANAGLGLLVLFKENKSKKENIFVVLTIIISSLIFGYIFHFLPMDFLIK